MTDDASRKHWMGLLAKAAPQDLARLWAKVSMDVQFSFLRVPEVGAVMVRGRAGATGAPFNLGEMTVARCSVQLEGGEIGHAYVQGRDKTHATQAAVIDALMQTGKADTLREHILDPLREDLEQARAARAARAAATKVDFFTMARGED
ncbi:phosphonate C-P lyase system protein PhnG [uncultured Roseovarius sp.]|uniref:phosphonate C-P lyase system protein PhnG n=1 Tax=uncultured Roseovarius sp. TaxID=293344 RepID=UPI0025EC5602|nr:phosphonate C-P lyase system protein PhnG [uncultured Roseovarius sp.]